MARVPEVALIALSVGTRTVAPVQSSSWPNISMKWAARLPPSPNFSHWATLKFCTSLQNFTKYSGRTWKPFTRVYAEVRDSFELRPTFWDFMFCHATQSIVCFQALASIICVTCPGLPNFSATCSWFSTCVAAKYMVWRSKSASF